MTTKTSSFQKNNSVMEVLKGVANKFERKHPLLPLYQRFTELERSGEAPASFYRALENANKSSILDSGMKVLKGVTNKFVRKDPFQPLHQVSKKIDDLEHYYKVLERYGHNSGEANDAFYRVFQNAKKSSTLDLNNEFFIRGIEDSFKEAGFWNELGVGAKSVAQDIGSAWNKIKPGLKGFGQTVKEHPGFMVGKLAPAVAVGGAGLYGAKKLVEHWGRKGAQKELAKKQK